jgi:hypothetical protein
MKPEHVDPKEMELRQNKDFNASLDMVGEGAPIYHIDKEETEVGKEDTL